MRGSGVPAAELPSVRIDPSVVPSRVTAPSRKNLRVQSSAALARSSSGGPRRDVTGQAAARSSSWAARWAHGGRRPTSRVLEHVTGWLWRA
jgi:hypothetical protein